MGQKEVTENIQYIKTHKQIKAISQELGLEMQKVKYLGKAQQISIIEKQLQKVLTQSNLDRNTVIDFLIQDYNFLNDEAKDIQVFPSPMKFGYNEDDL